MKTENQEESNSQETWLVSHPLTAADAAAMAAMRAIVEPNKGRMQGTAARLPFDGIMERVTPPENVSYEAGHVGGIPGVWCRPKNARPGEVVLHLHGGWFIWGTAHAFRNLVGHIAAQAGVEAFVPDYRLAPEHPFPAATKDVRAVFSGLVQNGFSKIAITGDSAGGNLALGLVAALRITDPAICESLVGSVVMSPVTDLSLSGQSWSARAAADPYFTQTQAAGLVQLYLANHDPSDPIASPLFADLIGAPPVRLHVGSDEVLLDDSIRMGERLVSAGVDARVHIWDGMGHGFLGGVGRFEASDEALNLIGAFLRQRLASAKV